MNRIAVLHVLLLPFFCLLIAGCSGKHQPEWTVAGGPYLGQSPPGKSPELFAPGIVNTGLFTRDLAMTPDGREIYFCWSVGNYTYTTILVVKRTDRGWTEPEVAPFASDARYAYLEPFISPDGRTFFFVSDMKEGKGLEGDDEDIWRMERQGNEWGAPENLGSPVNTEGGEYFPSVTRDGTLYFTRSRNRENRIYRVRPAGEGYGEPELLPEQVNGGGSRFNAFIAPDESYIIVPMIGRADSRGATDYYICFRRDDDTWTDPVNLGPGINTESGLEYSPYVSPDGRYFFFMSAGRSEENKKPRVFSRSVLLDLHNAPENGLPSLYWMEAVFIDSLKSLTGN